MQPPPNPHQRIEDNFGIYFEKPGLLAALSKILHAELRPRTFIERSIVATIAVTHWRQSRLRSFEQAMLEAETERQAATCGQPNEPPIHTVARAFRSLIDESRALSLIAREDARCSGTIAESLRLLAEYRKTPPPADQPEEDTRTPEEVAFDEILQSDPSDDDFAPESSEHPPANPNSPPSPVTNA